MMRHSSTLSSLTFLAIALLFASCKSSTSPDTNSGTGAGTAGTLTKPNAGSSYTYYIEQMGTDGRLQSSDTTVQTITRTGLTVDGKSDAFEVSEIAQSGMSLTTDFKYESNGDYSMYYPVGAYGWPSPSVWVTIPFASGKTFDKQMDTTDASGFTTYSIHMTAARAATENITVLGKNYVAEKAHFVMTASIGILGMTQTSATTEADYWFVPELGNIVKSDVPAYTAGTNAHGEQRQTLVKATLK